MNLTFLLWKVRFHLFGIDAFHKLMKIRYCSKGFHKLRHGFIAHSGTGQRMKYVHYLKCLHCNYIFFASSNDKKRYLRMTDRERSAFRTMLSSSEDEVFKRIGRNVWEEASSRASSKANLGGQD